MTNISQEIWLDSLLRNAGIRTRAFEGLTTQLQRKEHFRGVIVNHAIADKPARANDPTFGAIFENLYGEKP